MKRIIKILCIVVIILLVFPIVSSAHSGRTDSKGGHYDYSTGEYHYHNGDSVQSEKKQTSKKESENIFTIIFEIIAAISFLVVPAIVGLLYVVFIILAIFKRK